jgi:O-antigen/teichoic acid export membrane protein
LGLVGGILVKLYLPKGLYVRSIIWGILARILNFLSLVAAASLSQSTCVAMFFVCVFGALLNVALFLDIYREFESILPSWGDGSWNEGWRNFVKSLVLTVNAIGEQLSGNGVLILISRTFPVAQVAVFSSIKTISNVAFQGASVLGQPFSPDFARFIVKREAVKLLDSFHALWFVLGGLMVFFFSIAAPFVEPLYSLWTRNKLVFEPGLFVALILAVALRVISLPVVQCLISVNQLPSQTWMTWTRAFVSLGLSALTLPYYGLVGVGIGLAVGEFFGGFCVPAFYATRMLRAMGAKFSFLELWGPMSHIVVIGVVAYSATFTHVLPSIVSGGGGVVGILIAIFQWKSLSFDMRSRFVSLIFNNFHVLTRYKFAGQEHY